MKKRYNISNLDQIIEMFDLRKSDRHQPFLYRRYYLYYILHKNGYSMTHIGKIFNKDHSSIIHGIKVHKNMIQIKDKYYQLFVDELDELMNMSERYDLRDIQMDVLKCTTIKQLEIIKDRIQSNFYTFVAISFLICAL